ncbi:RDD family protein [Psychromicrobium xiongbiense]|uniref:RDD family protein n=1 Tax=Psychromicrobium xiongbiense TaxID=3051184 RepID=UPI00255225E5|nr:RDD family protein [Psychromicrobium sp. YIM S02556]
MVDRKDIGSWLSGPDTSHLSRYPGERLGLPERGQYSIARAGRRILALVIDWALASVISYALLNGDPLGTIGIFFIEQAVLVGTLGFSIGHRIANIHVVRQAPGGGTESLRAAGPLAGIARALLLCLVLPAVIVDPDHRGLHDKAMNTVLLRR